MRKKCTAVLVALTAAGVLLAASLAGASPLIEKNIPNTSCGINAYEPSISGGRVNGSALIDCNGKNYHLQVEGCIQESNTGSGGWSTVSGSCQLNPKSGSDYTSELGATPSTSERTSIWYRSWGWGWASGNTATVESDAVYSH
jgi:hypothetical protein